MDGRVITSGSKSGSFARGMQANENNKKLMLNAENRYVFTAEEFQRIMTNFQQEVLSERINKVIVGHSIPEENERIFYLYWTDSEYHMHALKVMLERSNNLKSTYSKFLNDKNFSVLLPGYQRTVKKTGHYYRLKVDVLGFREQQAINGRSSMYYEEREVLALWFTIDGFVGELRSLQASAALSADEIMRIYKYFAAFLCIENIFIWDDLMLADAGENTQIPLRVLAALAVGKTWYQESLYGLKLFEHKHFPLNEHDYIKQSKTDRTVLLDALRALTLDKWSEMLDDKQRQTLSSLYQEYFPKRLSQASLFRSSTANVAKSEFDGATLGDLVAAIYNDARKKKTVTARLREISDLLCGNIAAPHGAVPLRSSDSWVKTRIHQLMWGSLLWREDTDVIKRQASFQ